MSNAQWEKKESACSSLHSSRPTASSCVSWPVTLRNSGYVWPWVTSNLKNTTKWKVPGSTPGQARFAVKYDVDRVFVCLSLLLLTGWWSRGDTRVTHSRKFHFKSTFNSNSRVKGSIFNIIIDSRKTSKTWREWFRIDRANDRVSRNYIKSNPYE